MVKNCSFLLKDGIGYLKVPVFLNCRQFLLLREPVVVSAISAPLIFFFRVFLHDLDDLIFQQLFIDS